MTYFLTTDGVYYEGERANSEDVSVPQRPAANYVYENGTWVPVVVNVDRITAGQFIQQLILDQRDELAEAAIAAIENPVERKRIRARYDREAFFVISDPDLLMLATAVGYDTQEKIQAFFNSAALL